MHDKGLMEAIAYFIQDLWLKEHHGRGLLSYYEGAPFKTFKYFYADASTFIVYSPRNFFFNAIHWFQDNPKEKFKKAVNKFHIFDPSFYIHGKKDPLSYKEKTENAFVNCQ